MDDGFGRLEGKNRENEERTTGRGSVSAMCGKDQSFRRGVFCGLEGDRVLPSETGTL